MSVRPAAIAFDMLETVFGFGPLRRRLAEVGLSETSLELWYARTLRDGITLAVTGVMQPFRSVAEATLRGLLAESGLADVERRATTVLEAFSSLPAQPGAEDAMSLVRNAGVKTLALTNGSPDNTQTLLEKSGLDRYVERVVSIEEAGFWKPRAETYRYAAQVAGVVPQRLALVAVHDWDCHGAKRAGLSTAWISSPERKFNPVFDPPDIAADSLPAACEELLRLSDEA